LKSITEPFDTTNLAGKMFLQMLAVFAEFEHGTIVERTVIGMAKKAKTGVWVGGTVPYGYRICEDKKGLVVHEDEALIGRRMFKTYGEGRVGVNALCDDLNHQGHRKRRGAVWEARTVLCMLRNPVYAGKLKWKTDLYEGTHEPIVSQELYDRVQRVLEERSR